MINIFGTLLGVLVGGLISYFTINKQIEHERKLTHSSRQIEKIETTHEILTKIGVRYKINLTVDTTTLLSGTNKKEEMKIQKGYRSKNLKCLQPFILQHYCRMSLI